MAIGTYQSRKPDDTDSWWLQLLGIVGSQLLGISDSVVRKASEATDPIPPGPMPAISQAARKLIKHHLTALRSTIPNIEALDEEEHIQAVHPPPSPWSFPTNSYYREARPGRLNLLSEPLITDLVNIGLLIANDTGIRWRHMDQHILLVAEDTNSRHGRRVRLARSDPAAFRRARVSRSNLDGEHNTVGLEDITGTPIVRVETPPLEGGEKRVRLWTKRTCVLIDGAEVVVRHEEVVDNEGKSAKIRAREAEDARKERARSQMCWDSERWS
ncbi:hypothetical protein M3J09_002103 [Ascochyta lentis]